MVGFMIGILYANFGGVNYITTTGIFHEYFLNQYTNQKILSEEYFFYLLQQRIAPILLLVFASMTKFRKFAASLWMVWTGIAGGMIAVAAIIRMGIPGMLYYAALLFPHCIFYIFGYCILICEMMDSERRTWNMWKSFFLVISFAAGLVLEAYINPWILQWVMRIIY